MALPMWMSQGSEKVQQCAKLYELLSHEFKMHHQAQSLNGPSDARNDMLVERVQIYVGKFIRNMEDLNKKGNTR